MLEIVPREFAGLASAAGLRVAPKYAMSWPRFGRGWRTLGCREHVEGGDKNRPGPERYLNPHGQPKSRMVSNDAIKLVPVAMRTACELFEAALTFRKIVFVHFSRSKTDRPVGVGASMPQSSNPPGC